MPLGYKKVENKSTVKRSHYEIYMETAKDKTKNKETKNKQTKKNKKQPEGKWQNYFGFVGIKQMRFIVSVF